MHDAISALARAPASVNARGAQSAAARHADDNDAGRPPDAYASSSAASSNKTPQCSATSRSRDVTAKIPLATRAGSGGVASSSYGSVAAIVSSTPFVRLFAAVNARRLSRNADPHFSNASSTVCLTSWSSANASVGSSGRSGRIRLDVPGPRAGPTRVFLSCHAAYAPLAKSPRAPPRRTRPRRRCPPSSRPRPWDRARPCFSRRGARGVWVRERAGRRGRGYPPRRSTCVSGTLWSALRDAAPRRVRRARSVRRAPPARGCA